MHHYSTIKLINGHDFYINEWYRKGIRQVADFLDDQGNIYDFDVFKTRFGERGTILDCQSLIRKIPNTKVDGNFYLIVTKVLLLLTNLM